MKVKDPRYHKTQLPPDPTEELWSDGARVNVLARAQGRPRASHTYGSRFPGADNERSSRRLPSNGFPKDRFRIIVLTKICKGRLGLVRVLLLLLSFKSSRSTQPLCPTKETTENKIQFL